MYEVVPFNQKINGRTIGKKGYMVGDYLVVSWSDAVPPIVYDRMAEDEKRYRIYNVLSGRPVIPNKMKTSKEALEVAKFLSDQYKDYLLIAQEYPELDIISLAQWSIPDGVQINLALSALKDKDTIDLTEIQNAMWSVKAQADDLTRWMHAYS